METVVKPLFVGGLVGVFFLPRRKRYLVPAVQHAFDVPFGGLVQGERCAVFLEKVGLVFRVQPSVNLVDLAVFLNQSRLFDILVKVFQTPVNGFQFVAACLCRIDK